MSNDLEIILKTFTNDSLFVQMAAASALKAMGEPVVPGVADLLTHPKETIRAAAARLLGEIPIGDVALAAETIEALHARLEDTNPIVRWYAAGSLGEIATQHDGLGETAVPDLIELLEDDSIPHPSAKRAMCEVAASALRAIGTDEANAAVEAWWGETDDDWGL